MEKQPQDGHGLTEKQKKFFLDNLDKMLGDLPFSLVDVLGVHDAATFGCIDFPFTVTTAQTFEELLNAGVRAFDLRIKMDSKFKLPSAYQVAVPPSPPSSPSGGLHPGDITRSISREERRDQMLNDPYTGLVFQHGPMATCNWNGPTWHDAIGSVQSTMQTGQQSDIRHETPVDAMKRFARWAVENMRSQ